MTLQHWLAQSNERRLASYIQSYWLLSTQTCHSEEKWRNVNMTLHHWPAHSKEEAGCLQPLSLFQPMATSKGPRTSENKNHPDVASKAT